MNILKPKTSNAKVTKASYNPKELSELELEKFLFDQENEAQELDFFIDTGDQSEPEVDVTNDTQAAWKDNDDIQVDIQAKNRTRKLKTDFEETVISSKEYETRLRAQFEKINPTPKWATFHTETSVLDSTEKLMKAHDINPERLHVTRVKDANQEAYSKAVVQSCRFHPFAPILLTAGFDKKVTLFHIDEKDNSKVQSFHVKDLPIFSANFSPDGKQIVITGRRNFFYVLDLDAGSTQRIHSIQGRDEKSLEKSYISKCGEYLCVLGKDGFVIILSMKTKRWIGNVKMNATAVSLTFTKTHLWSVSLDGSVYQWDLKTLQCTHRFTDQGCIKATVISISDDEKWIAIGSQVGVVNVYSMSSCTLTETPEPTKVLMNLTTAITSLVFHPSSDLLAFGSHDIKDAFRLYHLPSQKVVKNWPTNNTPLGYVSSVDFSPSGKYIAIGNAKGKVILYRLEAFSK